MRLKPNVISGAEAILDERHRQMSEEGYTAAHDDREVHGQLADAAALYALNPSERNEDYYNNIWPWDDEDWKPCVRLDIAQSPSEVFALRIKELAKAGALIAAEIDRLQRIIDRATETAVSED